jgi:hypothetical protein
MTTVGVMGGGAWGTALAQVAVRAGQRALIWAREREVVDAINIAHQNPLFLPGVPTWRTPTSSSPSFRRSTCARRLKHLRRSPAPEFPLCFAPRVSKPGR